MRITRRDFLKYCAVAAGALGLTTTDLMKLEQTLASTVAEGGTQVVWLNGAACTGCTVSLANSAYYSSIQDLLVPWLPAAGAISDALTPANLLSTTAVAGALLAGKLTDTAPANGPLDLVFMETLSSSVGAAAVQAAKSVLTGGSNAGTYVLCIEGAIQTGENGNFCRIGNGANVLDPSTISFADEVKEFALDANCLAILAVGACASFGGIPAANHSQTGARGLISTGSISGGYATVNTTGYWDYLKANATISTATWKSLMAKTVCVSGCPPHPDWIVGTIVYILNYLAVPLMDKWHRPTGPGSFYGNYQCDNCLWQTNTPGTSNLNTPMLNIDGTNLSTLTKGGVTYGDSPKLFSTKYNSGYEGCLGVMGCKGRKTKADCSYRRWNSDTLNTGGVGWCVQTRAGCHGCTDPRFPDGWGKFFTYK